MRSIWLLIPVFRACPVDWSQSTGAIVGTVTDEDLVRLAAELGVDGLDLTVYWFSSTSDDSLLPRASLVDGVARLRKLHSLR